MADPLLSSRITGLAPVSRSATHQQARLTRRWEFDALRGLMLVLMTLTHLPTRLASPMGQPFGYVSAAEGFVLLSAFMAGMVYTRKGRRSGIASMRRAFWRRALVVYGCQLLTLVFLFTVIALLGLSIDQPAVKNLMSFYLQQPLTGLLAGVALVYQPPLLDILPLYILFLLASPWVLAHGMRQGWVGIMAVSLGLWLLAQFGATHALYDLIVQHTGLSVPFNETGAFDTMAWQLVWVLGLWMGASLVTSPRSLPPQTPFPAWMVVLALILALSSMVWRHIVGQSPLPGHATVNLLFDKWLMGPLRLINLLALMVVTLRFGPWLVARLPRLHALEAMGRSSLPVFCAHLAAVLVVLALFGEADPKRPLWEDALMLGISFALMLLVAYGWPQVEPRARFMRWRQQRRQRVLTEAASTAWVAGSSK